MKRALAVFVFIFALSFPAFGGHTQSGGRWCECTPVEGTCPCCGMGLSRIITEESVDTKEVNETQHEATPELELGTVLVLLLLWLRLRA